MGGHLAMERTPPPVRPCPRLSAPWAHSSQPNMAPTDEESMYEPLYGWLRETGRVDNSTLVVRDVPWLGNWIDLSILSAEGVATAYECKLSKTLDVIEQASKNAFSYHRSWIVIAVRPRQRNLDLATQCRVGVLHLSNERLSVLRDAPSCDPYPDVAERLAEHIHTRGHLVTSVGVGTRNGQRDAAEMRTGP